MQKTLIKSLLLIIAFTFALSANYIFAVWTGPTQAPPGGNTPTPVHVGATDQVKDAGLSLNSLAVFGNGFFDGNVGIGVTNPQAKLDVAGKIKVGDDTQTPTAGAIRFTGTDFEGYIGTEWKSLTSGGGGSQLPGYTNCVNAGGSWINVEGVCYFSGSSCPSDWTKKEAYSSTQIKYCEGCRWTKDKNTYGHCSTGSHTRKNLEVEDCTYYPGKLSQSGRNAVECLWTWDTPSCNANITEIGCIKN